MSTEQIVELLIQERDRLNRAIAALQSPIARRGRPPKSSGATASVSTKASETATPKPRGRTFSAAQRRKQAERMKAYWAAKHKQTDTAAKTPTTKKKAA